MIMEELGIGTQNKKLYYITDWNITPGYHKFDKHRFPQGYIELMPWFTLNWKDIDDYITDSNNIIFVNTPVGNELQKIKIIHKLILNNKVFILQEGCFWDWFEWPAEEQELYIDAISKCTAFVCSEDIAKTAKIFSKNLIHNRICTNIMTESPREKGGDYVFIINPIKRYQRGMISHKIVYDCLPKNINVYSMRYNRPKQFNELLSFPDSYTMPGFKLLDYMGNDEWLNVIYNSKFGVDINRDYAGGNSVLEFGSMGIPLIGNIELYPQQDIFPDISFEYHDVERIKKAIYLLLNDNDFYNEVSNKAHNRIKTHWLSHIVVNEFKQKLKPYING